MKNLGSLAPHIAGVHCVSGKDGSLCYFSIKENKRLMLLDGVKLAGAKAAKKTYHLLVLWSFGDGDRGK